MLARSAMVRASSDWPVEWSKAAPDTIKPNVFKRYLVSLRQVRPYLDHLYLDNIDRKVMAKVANRKGVSNATRRRDLTAVSSVLRFAVSQRIGRSPISTGIFSQLSTAPRSSCWIIRSLSTRCARWKAARRAVAGTRSTTRRVPMTI